MIELTTLDKNTSSQTVSISNNNEEDKNGSDNNKRRI